MSGLIDIEESEAKAQAEYFPYSEVTSEEGGNEDLYSLVFEPMTPTEVIAEDFEIGCENADVPAMIKTTLMEYLKQKSSIMVVDEPERRFSVFNEVAHSSLVRHELFIIRSALSTLSFKRYRKNLMFYLQTMEEMVNDRDKFMRACRLESVFFVGYYSVLLQNSYHSTRAKASTIINVEQVNRLMEKGGLGRDSSLDIQVWQIVLLVKHNFMTKFHMETGWAYSNMLFESFRKTLNDSEIGYSTLAQRQHFMCCLARSQRDIVGPKRTFERSKQLRNRAIEFGAARFLQMLIRKVHMPVELHDHNYSSRAAFVLKEDAFEDLSTVPVLERPLALFAPL
ncbi:hypothetical protein HDE_12953 [Halotydeus destructor]|nr:hypothetical protein HDE_12953 [Halotydeus destructor]